MKYWLIPINALALLFMYLDKQFAKRHMRRIPEAVLLGVAALGGSAGALAGMALFHHKTRKARFYLTLPLMLAAQLVLIWKLSL